MPVYAAPAAIGLLRALEAGGEALPGPRDFDAVPAGWQPAQAPVAVGPMLVERFDVDHDVPGASGYRVSPDSAMLHGNGEPLGAFDPRWPLYTDWLTQCGLPLRPLGCSGHAYQDHLHEMVHRIRPSVVVPIHTRSPYRLHPVGGTARLVVSFARGYDFAGRPVS